MEKGWASRRIAAEKAFADSVVALERAGLQVDLDQFREAKDGHLGFAFSGITYCGKKYVEAYNGKPRYPNLNYVDAFAKQMRGTPEGEHIVKTLQDWKRTHLPLAIERNRHFQRQMGEMVIAARAMGHEELAKRYEKRSIWDQGEVMNRLDLFATEFLNGMGIEAEQYRR
jgi:hypothetical protein